MDADLMKKMFEILHRRWEYRKPKDIPRMPTTRIPCTPEELAGASSKIPQNDQRKGADDARIVNARDIPQDPRVLLKCSSPKCPFYGRSGCCPPHCKGSFQEAKEYLNAYNWAIIYRVNIPEEGRDYVTGPTVSWIRLRARKAAINWLRCSGIAGIWGMRWKVPLFMTVITSLLTAILALA